MSAVLEVRKLRAYYRTRLFGQPREVRAVEDVSLAVRRNEIYGIAGESSCGKSTLVKVIVGAVRPPLQLVEGGVTFRFGNETVELYGKGAHDLAAIRWKHLSCILQGSMNVLNPVRRVRQSFLDFAFRHMGKPVPAFWDIVRTHLERLKLDTAVLDDYPHQLSGGMRQRVTIALATICRPEFIVADEPTTALDVVVQKSVLAMIREVQQALGSSLLFVTHDLSVHANLCDRLGIMYAGRLVEEGTVVEIFRNPRHPYTRHLIASLPRLGGSAATAALAGAPPSLADPPPGCRFHPRCTLATETCRRESPLLLDTGVHHRVACFAVSEGRA